MKTYVVMLAGGRGERMRSSVNKILLSVCGKPVIRRSVEAFLPFADEMVIVARPEDRPDILSAVGGLTPSFPLRVAEGGNTRQQSVLNGLRTISPEPDDTVLIHDAARCLVCPEVITRVIEGAAGYGACIPGIPATSTYKVCGPDAFVSYTPERSGLYEIQTPQGFRAETIISASLRAAGEGVDCTDDAGVLEHYNIPVKVVRGDATNIKLTEPEDLTRARNILEGAVSAVRIGMGYDVHRLVEGRKLILCGVEIPFELGLLGHSDADVALHALMDAMLGACALGDIGKYFPDQDELYRGISSLLLLKKTAGILEEHGYALYNADIIVAAQKPKLLPYIPRMRDNIAEVLGVSVEQISVKATTTEQLGFEGRMEGISSYAVCTIAEKK